MMIGSRYIGILEASQGEVPSFVNVGECEGGLVENPGVVPCCTGAFQSDGSIGDWRELR